MSPRLPFLPHLARGFVVAAVLFGLAGPSTLAGTADIQGGRSEQIAPAPAAFVRATADTAGPITTEPAAQPLPLSVPALRHGRRSKPVVALTFDDGWSPTATREILAILEEEHVPATFFPYGYVVRRSPGLWRRIAAGGYPIGNHTLSHADLTGLSDGGIRVQLRAQSWIVQAVTGAPPVPFVRPPFGAFNATTDAIAAEEGYRALVLWDVDAEDWKDISVATIVYRATRGTNGSIVLLHAGPPRTPFALRSIIDHYRARGFDFVTVPELLGPTLPPVPPQPLPQLVAHFSRVEAYQV